MLCRSDDELAAVFKYIEKGTFGDGHTYDALLKTVYEHDYYLVRFIEWSAVLKLNNRFRTTLDPSWKLRN
jgi:hypothetical protein